MKQILQTFLLFDLFALFSIYFFLSKLASKCFLLFFKPCLILKFLSSITGFFLCRILKTKKKVILTLFPLAKRVSCTSWNTYYDFILHSWKGFHFSFPLDMFHVVKEGLLTSRAIPFYFTSGFFTALAGALVSTSDVQVDLLYISVYIYIIC